MCVVDPGATKTVGSVAALEHVMAANQRAKGRSGVQAVDQSLRPTFSFGNSTTNQCLSTLNLELQADGKAGSLAVHALEAGSGPILLSIATLRKLGAVIDYETDTAVFRTLNPKKIVQLSRSATGHQLLPLASDWYANSLEAKTEVPGLMAYC